MIFSRWAIVVSVTALVVASCATKRSEIILDTKATEAKTVIALLQQRQSMLTSVVGRGTVTFESPQMAGTAAFELSLKKPDSLLVAFEGPFGINLGTLFIGSDKYLMYSSFENKVVTGSPNSTAIRSIIPFDLTLDQVVGAFSGAFPLPDSEQLRTYAIDNDMFLLSFNCAGKMCTYWIDARFFLVKKYEMRDEDSTLIMDAETSSFTEEEGTSAPTRIRIRFPSEAKQVSVSYSSITLNEPSPSFEYSIPSSARIIVR